jgi:signal transduction histidine kinase
VAQSVPDMGRQTGTERDSVQSVDDLLQEIVSIAATSTGARYAAIGVIGDRRTRAPLIGHPAAIPAARDSARLATFITHGLSEPEKTRLKSPPSGHGMLGALIDSPTPVRVSDMSRDPRSAGLPPGHPPMRTLLGVPIRIGEEVFGNLYLTEKKGGGDFTERDESIAIALAAAAGIAVDHTWRLQRTAERASSRSDSAASGSVSGAEDESVLPADLAEIVERSTTAAVHHERDRISRDLHDVVIQRLFAGGIELKRSIQLVADDEVAARLKEVVSEIDCVIRELRRTVFDLRNVAVTDDVQSEVTRLVGRAEASLKFRPTVSFAGPVRLRVGDELIPDVVAVIGEALSNVARHADASDVQVEVAIVGNDLRVRVSDDGAGMPAEVRPSGLGNLAARAQARGGEFRFGPRSPRGTELEWQVPLG